MIKPQYITRPAQRDPEPTNVVNHDDIDWRTVQVAEAIDEERQRQLKQRDTLEALKARRTRTIWSAFTELLGGRRS